MQRIVIIGTSSSGKTTLGMALSEKLNIEHKDLDCFYWEPGWTEANVDDFRTRVKAFTENDSWITNGNFSQVRDLVWDRATDIIWLDYPFKIIIKQFFKRSFVRAIKGNELWNGNKETLWNSILRPDSLLVWILKTYRRYKKDYLALMNSGDYPHAKFIRLRNPSETKEFLNTL